MAVTYGPAIRGNLDHLAKIYKANKTYSHNRSDLLKCAQVNLQIAKAITCTYVVTCGVFLLTPFIVYAATSNIETFFPIRIPFLRNDTLIGYTLHTLYGIIILASACCGTLGPDLFIITMTIQYWPMTRCLDHAVDALNLETGDKHHETIRESVWIKECVRNICLMHGEIHQSVYFTQIV